MDTNATAATPAVSVCLCTHRPRPDYLGRTLASLARQTLAEPWELVLVDNASPEPVEVACAEALKALPARVVREPRLGLTFARLAALEAARAEVLVFVDDDNELAPDYLEQAVRIMRGQPEIGAAGGRRIGAFETPPPAWARYFVGYLAVYDGDDEPKETRERHTYRQWFPAGAGLVIRRGLMAAYARELADRPQRRRLDRVGASLSGSGDVDMLMTVTDAGWAVAYRPELRLTHLIPAARLEYGYLRRMIRTSMRSYTELLLDRRGEAARPLAWPLEYLRSLAMCMRAGQLRPRTLLLALQIAAGRYDAWRSKPQMNSEKHR